MLKRAFDLILVVFVMPLWVPLVAVIALVSWRKLGSPVFFRQRRPGLNGRIFELIKFRTMREAQGSDGRPLPDDARLTPFGRWLRATSFDELPELFNVLRGEMSLVGPRPLLVQYLERYTSEQARRHQVRPGITGLAQVMGRNALSWEEKFKWDLRYVDHHNLWLDCKILWSTLKRVILHEGISAPGDATMPEFRPSAVNRTGATVDRQPCP
jgi:lipopolysaccharide/colanic/teichoic acid biosynthesis glycosyltransferase